MQDMPEEQRGFAVAALSKVYECAPADTASSAAAWNDTRVHYSDEAAGQYAAKLAKNFERKMKGSFFLVTRDVHKRMHMCVCACCGGQRVLPHRCHPLPPLLATAPHSCPFIASATCVRVTIVTSLLAWDKPDT